MTADILIVPDRTPPRISDERHRRHVEAEGGYGASYAEVEVDRVVVSLTRGAPWVFGGPARETRTVGMVAIEVCKTCLYAATTCLHTKSTWRKGGKRLLCDLCGVDGT